MQIFDVVGGDFLSLKGILSNHKRLEQMNSYTLTVLFKNTADCVGRQGQSIDFTLDPFLS
jgi:hypothetical protein